MTSAQTPPRKGSSERLAEIQAEWESRELMRSVLTHQFGNGAVVRVGAVFERSVLEQVASEVARRIVNIPPGRQFLEHRRARFLVDAVKQVVRQGSERARTALLSEASDLARAEVEWLGRVGKDLIGVSWRTPAPALVESAVTRTPMMGRPFGEWFSDWIPKQTETRIVARVRAGMLAGESPREITTALQGTRAAGYRNGVMAQSRRAMETIVRTTVAHTAAQARNLSFLRNADVVQKVRWLSVLDLRTSIQCMALDGKTWPVAEPHPMPPIHPRCRSTLTPAIGPPIGKRAALGGRVEANVVSPEWLKTRTVAEQNLALGRTRAEAWRAGRLSIDEMTDVLGTRVLTLDELRAAGRL